MCGVVRARDNSPGGDGQMAYRVVVAGGLNKNGYTDSVEIYDMRRDKWDMGKLVLGQWEEFLSTACCVFGQFSVFQYVVFRNHYCFWSLKLATF